MEVGAWEGELTTMKWGKVAVITTGSGVAENIQFSLTKHIMETLCTPKLVTHLIAVNIHCLSHS